MPTVEQLKCQRCGHEWYPNSQAQPKVCPKCKSPYWNVQRGKETPLTVSGVRQAITERDVIDRREGALYMAVGGEIEDRSGRMSGGTVSYGRTPEEAKDANPDWEYVAVLRQPDEGDNSLAAQNIRRMIADAKRGLKWGTG